MYTTNTTPLKKTEHTQMTSVENPTDATYNQSSSAAPIMLGASSTNTPENYNESESAINIVLQNTLAPRMRGVSHAYRKEVDGSTYRLAQDHNNDRNLYFLLMNPTKLLEILQKETDPNATLKDLIGIDILDLNSRVLQAVDTKNLFRLAKQMYPMGGGDDDNKINDIVHALLLTICDAKRSNRRFMTTDEVNFQINHSLEPRRRLNTSSHRDFWKAVIASPTEYGYISSTRPEIPAELKENTTTALALIARNPTFLKELSGDLKSDRDFVAAAIEQNYSCFSYASNELRSDKAFVLEQMQHCGKLYTQLPTELQEDREIIIAAVKADPSVLHSRCIPRSTYADKEIMMTAVKKDIRFYDQIVSPTLKEDPEIMEIIASRRQS